MRSMGDQWPWLMTGTGLWTLSVVLMVWGTAGGVLVATIWALWIAMAACVVTAEIIVARTLETHQMRVEQIAAIAAEEAVRLRPDVRPIHR